MLVAVVAPLMVVLLLSLLSAPSALTQSWPPAPGRQAPYLRPPLSSTRLLFPFVSNQAGFDTGIADPNTGRDTTGTVGKPGFVTLHYFGTCRAAARRPRRRPPTRRVLPEDSDVVLSSGGGFGIVGRPGFQGYIEVDCDFPLAHGYGLLTHGPIGVAKVGTALPALVLDANRTAAGVESAGQ